MGDDHHEIQQNPEYDGPGQHCLPPEVKETLGGGVYFTILIVLVVVGAVLLGNHLLAG